jgi:hypothetical protein
MPDRSQVARCPVCSSERIGTRGKVTCEEAAQHFVLREENLERNMALESHIRGLWEDDHCYLRQCMDCGFGFADPFVAGDMTFYNLAYKRAHYPKDKWEYQRTLADLSQKCFRGQRVLEVGSGFGHFLDKIADTYVAKSGITALEFDDNVWSAAGLQGKSYGREDKSAAMYSAFGWRYLSWP